MGSRAMDHVFLTSTLHEAYSSQSFDDSVDKYLTDPDDPRLYLAALSELHTLHTRIIRSHIGSTCVWPRRERRRGI